jgi:hypothetical protein
MRFCEGLSTVMPALVAGIHVFLRAIQQARRGWPEHRRAKRRPDNSWLMIGREAGENVIDLS